MEVLYEWIIVVICEHSQNLGAITKTIDVRTLKYGTLQTKLPSNLEIGWSTWVLGFVNPSTTTATLPTAMYYFHLCTILRYRFHMYRVAETSPYTQKICTSDSI